MPGSHVPVALGDGGGHGQIAVLAVHVVGAGARVVPGIIKFIGISNLSE